jgi:hypothetical protein
MNAAIQSYVAQLERDMISLKLAVVDDDIVSLMRRLHVIADRAISLRNSCSLAHYGEDNCTTFVITTEG